MKHARRLRAEVDLWVVAWQQVETFLDRIAGAADQDGSARRKLQALLDVAAVVERARQPTDTKALGAPVRFDLPTRRVLADGSTEPIGDAWSAENRIARLPGLDDLELAAGSVSALDAAGAPIDGDLTTVRLMAGRSVPIHVDGRAGTVTSGVLPSYRPATPPDTATTADTADTADPAATIVGPLDRLVDIDGGGADLAGLFSVGRRILATMGTAPDQEYVRTWGELAADRRTAADDDTRIPADPPSAAGAAAVLAAQAVEIVEAIRAGTLPAATAGAALSTLVSLAGTAGAAGAAGATDAAVLEAAADTLDDEGTDDDTLPDAVRGLAAALRGTAPARAALLDAVTALAGAAGSTTRQDTVLTRARQLGVTSATAPLLRARVEDGPLRADLDSAVAGRLHYPDGSLRVLRTLEEAFAVTWPQRVRWFTVRRDLILAPLVQRFRAPFHASLRALCNGGDTGLLADGLTVGASVPVGATQVVTGEPASLRDAVDDLEPGQVGVVGGDRPAALTVLGLDVAHGRLALQVAPLRVSVTPGGPGLPGLLAGGVDGIEIATFAPGLTADELRSGESAQGPAADGIVAETLALWSRCCAVFGRPSVEAAGVAVPDPPGGPLHQLALHGDVPANPTTLVLTGLPETMWDRTDPTDPAARVARPGELLLIRGSTPPDGDTPTAVVQAVVEVDTVARTTGSMLAAMDLSSAGRLSAAPPPAEAAGAVPAPFRCGPEDDVAVLTLRGGTADVPLTGPLTLRRDFAGFDVISLATRRLLPADLFGGTPPATGSGPWVPDRSREFAFAATTFADWLAYAHNA